MEGVGEPGEREGVAFSNGSGRVGRFGVWLRRTATSWLLLGLIMASLTLRLLWLDRPANALIFDEAYYVNAARVILGLPTLANAPYADAPRGLDPNKEHPPLGKLLIAGSMHLFGDNAWGWRLASVLFGTLAIPLLYGIARRLGAAAPLALLAAALFAFDNLVFVHSRIGTLDIFMVAFLLLGVYCYLASRPLLAGVALAGATLCKIGGVYGLGALLLFEGLRAVRSRVASGRWEGDVSRPVVALGTAYLLAFALILGLLDSRWGQWANAAEHIGHILRYGFALTRVDGPQGQESVPWQWLINEVQMVYYRADTQVVVGGETRETRALIYFRGALNPLIVAGVPLAIAYAARQAWQERDDLSFFTLALFCATYLPFWPAALIAHRISYLFYFLPTIPAVALGLASFLRSPAVPRAVRWAFVGAVLLGFYGYFPFKAIP